MSKSKKKAKGSNQQKRSNKFLANKLRTNQSRSAFKAQEELEAAKVSNSEQVDVLEDQTIEATAEPVEQTTNTNTVVKNEQVAEPVAEQEPTQEDKKEKAEPVAAEQKQKDKDKQKDKKKKDKKGKRKFGQRTKETFAELKRVTWPTFGETMKKTGLVIAVVLFFGLALFAIERLLSWLYTLLTSGIVD